MNQVMLSRDKPLSEMSFIELVRYIGKLCELYDFEYCQLSTGQRNIEVELLRAIAEVQRTLCR